MTQLAPQQRPTPRAPAPPPELESFAGNLYAGMDPVAWLDATVGWALAHFCAAIGVMFQDVEDLARDTSEGPGWSGVMDLDRCPDAWLPWLAQFVGVTVVPGSTPAEMRARIASTDGFKRGTPAALAGAARATLTGSQVVWFRERDPTAADPPYSLEVVTLTSQTPSATTTRAALIAQKPAGIILNYRTSVGRDYTQLKTVGTYAQVKAQFPTYNDVISQGIA